MELPNYYEILKIDRSADLDTIKKAFRREIALYHPDKNKSETARTQFELIVEAFNVLSKQERRASYDKWLESSSHRQLVAVEPAKEEQYKEWKKEAKQKSEDYWFKDLSDLLLLDIFLSTGWDGLFDQTDSLLDGIGDVLGDLGDFF